MVCPSGEPVGEVKDVAFTPDERVVTTTRFEFVVPTAPYAAGYKDINDAVNFVQDRMTNEGVKISDNNPKFTAGDDEIIIYFEKEVKGNG